MVQQQQAMVQQLFAQQQLMMQQLMAQQQLMRQEFVEQPTMQSPVAQQGMAQGISPLVGQQLTLAMQSPQGQSQFDSSNMAHLIDGHVQSAVHNLLLLQPGLGDSMGSPFPAAMQSQTMHGSSRLPYFGSPNAAVRRRQQRAQTPNYYAPFGTNNPVEYYFN